jgi:hypothetical protein
MVEHGGLRPSKPPGVHAFVIHALAVGCVPIIIHRARAVVKRAGKAALPGGARKTNKNPGRKPIIHPFSAMELVVYNKNIIIPLKEVL